MSDPVSANPFSGKALEIAKNGVTNMGLLSGPQAAYDLNLALLSAYGVVLLAMVGPKRASAVVYELADTLATSDEVAGP